MRDSSNTCPWPCPLYCFSRPSSGGQHCCNLDSSPTSASLVLERKLLDGKVEIEEEEEKKKKEPDGGELRTRLRSILKKPVGAGSDAVKKGRVRWRDAEGKELAEIREFDNEPREPVMNDDNIPICGLQMVGKFVVSACRYYSQMYIDLLSTVIKPEMLCWML